MRLTLAAALLLAATPIVAQTPAAQTPLIPRALLYGNPERTNPQISPDGRLLAWLAPRDGVMNLWVAPVERLDAARPLTADTVRPIRVYQWSPGGRLLYQQDAGGDENFQLFDVDPATATVRNLTNSPKARVEIIEDSFARPDELLIGLNDRDEKWHDLYRLNLRTGAKTRVFRNDGYTSFVADETLTPRLAIKSTPEGGSEVFRIGKAGEVSAWGVIPPEDDLTTVPLGFAADGATFYMLDSRGRDTAALVAFEGEGSTARVLGASPNADVGGIIVEPRTRRVTAWGANRLKTEWTALDKATAADLAFVKAKLPGEISVTSQSADDRRWVLAHDAVTTPVDYHLFDRDKRTLTPLFSARPKLVGQPLAAMRAFEIPTRDGKSMVSYLTLSRDADPDGDGRPTAAQPMVLLVHGGPWARDAYGFNRAHQWLANRGYAVLSVNFRGSTGFGKAFTNAGDREWGAKMHDDLLDAVAWAEANGVAAKGRTAIMGGSYGGYATLVGLTMTPTAFACGVDIVGPSNITTLLNSIPPYWTSGQAMFTKRVGDWKSPEGQAFLKTRSPISFVDKIQRPLLIGQGANDPRVKQAESDQIVAAMQARNIPVTYVLFPDEGHGFAKPANNTAFNAVTEAFLAQCLGGRFEPIGRDFNGSTIVVKTGANKVPGLAAALPGGGAAGR